MKSTSSKSPRAPKGNPNRRIYIPIARAKEIAKRFDMAMVILVAWDEYTNKTHVVTYGRTLQQCDFAAMGGNKVKAAMGWPEALCQAEPSRVTKLKKRIKQLEDELERASR